MHQFILYVKEYVCLFQMEESPINKLYEEQKQLFTDFLSLFVKPEILQNKQMTEILDSYITCRHGRS